jgi:predicted Fe-Mo cluster-binding NifX family protein
MKIAIFTDGPNQAANVAYRIGTAKWLLLADADSGAWEAVPDPVVIRTQGTGVQAVAPATGQGAQVILTSLFNAIMARQFEVRVIEILSGFKGSAEEALQEYQKGRAKMNGGEAPLRVSLFDRAPLVKTVRSAARQFSALVPVLAGSCC